MDEVRAHERELETKVESLQETITKIGEDAADASEAEDARNLAREEAMMSAIANAVTKTQKEMSLEKDKAVQLALSQVEQAVTEAVAASEEAAEIALGQALGKVQEDASQREAELMHQVAELEDQVETLMEQGESSNKFASHESIPKAGR